MQKFTLSHEKDVLDHLERICLMKGALKLSFPETKQPPIDCTLEVVNTYNNTMALRSWDSDYQFAFEEDVVISVANELSSYQFESKIYRQYRKLLFLYFPQKVEINNLREHKRTDVTDQNLPVSFRNISHISYGKQHTMESEATLRDMSLGGMSIKVLCPDPEDGEQIYFERNDNLEILKINEVDFSSPLSARVRHKTLIETSDGRYYYVGMEFDRPLSDLGQYIGQTEE